LAKVTSKGFTGEEVIIARRFFGLQPEFLSTGTINQGGRNISAEQRSGTNVCDWAYPAMSDADECRKMAEECRQEAAKAVNPIEQQRWLEMREQWLGLAEAAERGGRIIWSPSRGSP
jgi:hypothetical protein